MCHRLLHAFYFDSRRRRYMLPHVFPSFSLFTIVFTPHIVSRMRLSLAKNEQKIEIMIFYRLFWCKMYSLWFCLLQEYTGPGGAEEEVEKPSKDEYDIAKWIKKNVPTKKTKFLNHHVEYFTGMCINAILHKSIFGIIFKRTKSIISIFVHFHLSEKPILSTQHPKH